jgi:hypothetical protein
LEVRTTRPVQALYAAARVPGVAYSGIGWTVRARLPLIEEAALQIAQRSLANGGPFGVNVVVVGKSRLVPRDIETAVAARILAGLDKRARLADRRGGTVLHVIVANDEAVVFDWLVRGVGGRLLVPGELGVFIVDHDPSSVVAGWLALRSGIAPVFLTYSAVGDGGRLSTSVMNGLARLRDYVPLTRVDLFVLPDPGAGQSHLHGILMRVLVAEQLALQLRASWIVGALASAGPTATAFRQIASTLSNSVTLLEATLSLTEDEVSDLATRILGRPVRYAKRGGPYETLMIDRAKLTQNRADARAWAQRAQPRPVPALAEFTWEALK